MPTPVFSLISGASSGGLSYAREIYVLTTDKNISLWEHLHNYFLIQNEMRKIVKNALISTTGGFLVDQDSVEEILKIANNAIK